MSLVSLVSLVPVVRVRGEGTAGAHLGSGWSTRANELRAEQREEGMGLGFGFESGCGLGTVRTRSVTRLESACTAIEP